MLLVPSEKLDGFNPLKHLKHQGGPKITHQGVDIAHHSLNSAVGLYSLGYIHCLLDSSVQTAGFASSRTIISTLSTHSSDQIKNFARIKPKFASFHMEKMTSLNSDIFFLKNHDPSQCSKGILSESSFYFLPPQQQLLTDSALSGSNL